MTSSFFADLKMACRFFFGLKGYLDKTMTFGEARRVVAERLAQRQENFLKILARGVFGYEKSPYLKLFQHAGLRYADVEKLVLERGLEGALGHLKDNGVYFTIEEFKGKKPVRRPGLEFMVEERDFDNPYILPGYESVTGGTRSAGTRVMVDFDFLAQAASHEGLVMDMHGLSQAPVVIMHPVFPYGAGMAVMLKLAKFGIYPLKWFSVLDERSVAISLRSRLAMLYLMYAGRLFGAKFPRPEFYGFKDIGKVIQSISHILQNRGACYIAASVSPALRICLAAGAQGLGLGGVTFHGAGEPLTAAKIKEIESVGAKFVLHYCFTEAGLLASSCAHPSSADDMHFFKDSFALIARKRPWGDSDVNAFLVTTLLASAPKVLLNVESGDYGRIEERSCGCFYEGCGLSTHLYDIRSFEKLSAEAMTFYGSDIARIAEEVLPERFGGSGLDYQFVEETSREGVTGLVLYASPRLGPLEDKEITTVVLDELKKGRDADRMMAETWKQAGTIKVRRAEPLTTKSGKLYPVHIFKEGGL